MIEIDSLDYLIIQELHQNARISASDIARKFDANERTVRNRIDKLVRENVIRLTAIVNPVKFGYITAADIFLDANPSLEKEILQKLVEFPQVTYLALGQGSNDISIEARFKDNEELREFIHRTLPTIPGVKVRGYALVPRIIRNIDEWLPAPDVFTQAGDKEQL